MQIAPTTPPALATPSFGGIEASPVLPAGLTRADIGYLSSRHHDSELIAKGAYGLREGYTSLNAAVSHLGYLTSTDTRKGAAILEFKGRFYGVRVLEKVSDARMRSGMRGAWLDIEDDSKLRLQPFDQHFRLRAVLDGTKVLYSKFV